MILNLLPELIVLTHSLLKILLSHFLIKIGVALVVFQFFLYEALMHRCCTTGPAGTFFGFIATSSAAIFILPIAAQIVSDPAYLSTVMTGAQSNSNHTSFWPVFSTIVISLIFYRVTATSAFSTLGIIANESVDKELRGDHRI